MRKETEQVMYTIEKSGTVNLHTQSTGRQYEYFYSSAVPNNIPNIKEKRNNTNSQKARRHYLAALRRKYFKIAMCGIISFSSCYFFIGRLALISEKQNELTSISNETREVQSLISATEATLAEKLDVSTIERIAMNELNMRMPLPHQIEEIVINESNHTWD